MSALRTIVFKLIEERHFEELTLTKDDVQYYAAIYVAILLSLTIFGVVTLKHEAKRFAWLISLVNSGVMTLLGVIYAIVKFSQYPGVLNMTHNDITVFNSVDNFTALASLWFAIANMFDLAVGSLFYPKYVGLLTGWVHHTLFIWIMHTCTTGNALYATVRPFASLFVLLCIEEFPTFLLSLGSMFPSCRVDLGFGVSFFLLRILYHGYMFAYLVKLSCDNTVIGIFVVSLTMHLNWFYAWVTKYGIGGKKENKKSA